MAADLSADVSPAEAASVLEESTSAQLTVSEDAPVPTQSFADFGIRSEIADALSEAGISTPFPIQAMTLPIALSGSDVIGQARTGTGKTLAFGIPLLERLINAGVDVTRDRPDAPRPGRRPDP